MKCHHCGGDLGSGAERRMDGGRLRWHSECWVPWLMDRLDAAADDGDAGSTTVEFNWRALVVAALSCWLLFGLAFRGAEPVGMEVLGVV